LRGLLFFMNPPPPQREPQVYLQLRIDNERNAKGFTGTLQEAIEFLRYLATHYENMRRP
jgi:hypothetical protein